MLNYKKYKRVPVVKMETREWPDKEIQKAPAWCSVDLRDGNQALIEPMVVEEKIEFFNMLVKLGFKEIEVGFPSASQIEYDFLRQLVDRNLIPDDVMVQVLVQCREHLIARTFEALDGIKQAVVHIYNSTSTLQRDVVFGMSKDEIKQIAIDGTKLVKKYAEEFPGKIVLEYSPESFTGTELDYALDVCNAVQDVWQPTPDNKIIFNLPATVEMTTPNVYADQIEWMNKHFKDRDSIILSVHPHNDRGTGIAATELALLAGADRVEGTLFGNGERTGNVDVLTIAYNMFSQGINPELNLEHINEIIEVYERCCKMPVGMRHPYAGKLVFTAFSGSHQDAINKGIHAMAKRNDGIWEVPYLPIDPSDVGREYEPIVRINSQSGKGGVAFVMDTYFGFKLPKGMHKEFADVIQKIAEEQGEVSPDTIMDKFTEEYLVAKTEKEYPYEFESCQVVDNGTNSASVKLTFKYKGEKKYVEAEGTGPIDAVQKAIMKETGVDVKLLDYTEHTLGEGSHAKAAAYIQMLDKTTKKTTFGVGVSSNITRASIRAIFSALDRLEK
ncbi:MAG: 2-isopropylmalate synthase [Clostridiales bacterium]|jgi:2-isopropylmalate synthase|uniref:2-isopropylmalate synthase n=1 Tax=Bovifimicola ammoniilytica TaxID=2981720 RepID=UPI0003414725|nr:2-isopropylmalate synthase [Bovifimicola ammoniilytica]MBD8942717.1 2-isopropylmalate synthase [Clostridiales bacterium]MCU6752383.1 2-isopropylmalate synthase [Bovifimicola ammoniilytica]CCZ04300.1 2-isopropylmalate synthase [Eubacterium sp. CAG:603]SCJ22930.1 2-isopropylmalate synthase [uncultured Eubacterium sp.]